jgi:hypothetical protein
MVSLRSHGKIVATAGNVKSEREFLDPVREPEYTSPISPASIDAGMDRPGYSLE